MDVLQQAGKTICQRDAERCQQVVPVWLHVFTGPALGITLAARVLVVWGDDVGDEVVVTTGGLGRGETDVLISDKQELDTQMKTIMGNSSGGTWAVRAGLCTDVMHGKHSL